MKFEEILPALRAGKKITNLIIKLSGYKYIYYKDGTIFEDKGGYWHLASSEIVEQDNWEIVKEKKKIKLRFLTEEQYEKWQLQNCGGNKCNNCIFNKVSCVIKAYCWIKDKSLFSDKFLDQEIEIDEE